MSGEVDEREAAATELLSSMATMLAVDGYDLAVNWERDAKLRLVVTARPDACEECLVPASLFGGLAADKLGEGGIEIAEDQIDVVYPGA